MNVLFVTDVGSVELFFDCERAPLTTAYFVELIKNNKFDDSSFFRIVSPGSNSSKSASPISVLQCGHWLEEDEVHDKIAHESTDITKLSHQKWTLSAARFGAGDVYESLFICMDDEPELNFGGARHPDGKGFAAFGNVVKGFSVLEHIYADREVDEFQSSAVKIIEAKIIS